jgi:hypothetical protein
MYVQQIWKASTNNLVEASFTYHVCFGLANHVCLHISTWKNSWCFISFFPITNKFELLYWWFSYSVMLKHSEGAVSCLPMHCHNAMKTSHAMILPVQLTYLLDKFTIVYTLRDTILSFNVVKLLYLSLKDLKLQKPRTSLLPVKNVAWISYLFCT